MTEPAGCRCIPLFFLSFVLGISVGEGNIVFAQGNARKYLGEYLTSENTENPYEEDPFDIHCLSFSANGDVLDGNIYQNSITEIMCGYTPQTKNKI